MFELLSINKVLKYETESIGSKPVLERILWIDPNNNELVVININSSHALPEIKKFDIILSLVNDGVVKVLEFYRKEKFTVDESNIPEKWRILRDKAWSIIEEIVKKEPDVYYQNSRAQLISQALSKYKTTKPSIYKYLRRYWQDGKTKACLLPDYLKCGGKGKEKNAKGMKRGRTRKRDKEVLEQITISPQCVENIKKAGINITEKERKDIYRAVRDFYKSTNKYPLRHTYEQMIFRDYIIGYELIDDIEVPVLKAPESLPSFGQFKYWANKDNDIKSIIISREGEKRYELNHRPVLGKSTHQAFGPGSRYQIDASIASVYLVNKLTRKKTIKRATIYVVIDVFSRLIAGLYIGLENPSWLGAAMALANTSYNKADYCKKFGINIKESDWPCAHLPELLTADRGELEGDKPDNLINTLGVDVEILPPYRADWKGIVESEFRRLDVAAVLWLPGSIKKRYRERGEKDYRLNAALTLEDFTKIIINCVLFYNNKHRMNWYDMNEFQIHDNIRPIPIHLWNWGMLKRTGRLKQYPEDIIKLNLMLSDTATVTYKGIKLGKHLFYTCPTAEKENWFQKARSGRSWKVPISYDPREPASIYIRLDNGMDYEKCYLLESSSAFRNLYMEEVEDYSEDENADRQNYEHEELREKAVLNIQNQRIIKAAIAETACANESSSGREKISGIRETTASERVDNWKDEAFILIDKNGYESCSNAEIQLEDEFDYIPAQNYIIGDTEE